MFYTSDISRESLKYQRFTSSSCKDGRSSKIEFKTSNIINLIATVSFLLLFSNSIHSLKKEILKLVKIFT